MLRITRDLLAAISKKAKVKQPDLAPLAPKNDPFLSGTEGERAKAAWFAELWEMMDYPPGTHVRSIHYHIATKLHYTYRKHDGTPYVHTQASYGYMTEAAKAARHLGLVEGMIEDQRSDRVLEYARPRSEYFDGTREPGFSVEELDDSEWEMPSISVSDPATFPMPGGAVSGYDYHPSDQPVHVEVWIEKTMAKSHIERVCETHAANLQWGKGTFGIEVSRALVERAREWGKPVRVLYLADYDPAGIQMPVSMARQVEFILHEAGEHDLDIKVEVIAVTAEQIVELDLPRPPMQTRADDPNLSPEDLRRFKWAQTRRDNFEKYLGEGGTELNAIDDEDLASIIERRILRYRDLGLRRAVEEAEREAAEAADEAVGGATVRFQAELADLAEQQREIVERYRERVDALNRLMAEELEPVRRRSEELRHAVAERLEALDPDLPDYPEGETEGDHGDAHYLYNSSRDYFRQMRYYRRRQGREEEWIAVLRRVREAANRGHEGQ